MISVGGQIIEVGGAAIAISTAFSVRPWACPSRSARDRRLVPRSARAAGRVTRSAFLENLPCTRVLVAIVPPPRSAPSLELSSPDRQTNRKLLDGFSVGDSLGAPACRHHARPRAQRGVFGITMSTASAET